MPGQLTRLHKLDTTRTRTEPRPRLKPRGLPPALEPHGVYVAHNPAEAAMFGHDLLGTHRVHVLGGETPFRATFHGVLIRDVTLGYLDYSTAVRVEVRSLSHDYLVIVPANGSATVSNLDRRVITSPVMAATPRPGSSLTLQCDADTAHLVVRIDRSALEVHLSRLLGRMLGDQLEFDLDFDLSNSAANRWNFAVQMLYAELHDPASLLHRATGLGQIEEFVMSSLLYSHRSNYSELLNAGQRIHKRAVRVAVEYIDRNLALPITVKDVANEAGVGVRSLQVQFAEALQQSPSAYLRNRRLERARADLSDESPSAGATVTEIAHRWGFNHLGRFATVYKARFGESPSTTLNN